MLFLEEGGFPWNAKAAWYLGKKGEILGIDCLEAAG